MASISFVCRYARPIVCAGALLAGGTVPIAHADVVTSANERAAAIASKLTPTPFAVRAMAMAQVAVFAAANAVTQKYTDPDGIPADTGASLDAAVAAANRGVLLELVPNEREAIEADYAAAMRVVPDDPARQRGIALGERAASTVLAACADDGAAAPSAYRPTTAAGTYAPTTLPAVPHWGQRPPLAHEQRPAVPATADRRAWAPRPGRGTTTRSRPWAPAKARSARAEQTREREVSGKPPRRSCTGTSCVRSQHSPAATSRPTRGCWRSPRWRWTTH